MFVCGFKQTLSCPTRFPSVQHHAKISTNAGLFGQKFTKNSKKLPNNRFIDATTKQEIGANARNKTKKK